jgi:hypothetical protein
MTFLNKFYFLALFIITIACFIYGEITTLKYRKRTGRILDFFWFNEDMTQYEKKVILITKIIVIIGVLTMYFAF